MRLWSLHPKYLDRQGLLAVWREGLLAQKVLLGMTKGYKNHPQLIRFKKQSNYITYISAYLLRIFEEAKKRDYQFKISKIDYNFDYLKELPKLTVTTKQLEYEFKHLQNKLKNRCPYTFSENYWNNFRFSSIDSHPLFKVIKGDIESWEKIK